MASENSHFFIEQGSITAQTNAQAFGISGSPDVFNTTSRFTLSAVKKAFAICKGVVLIQSQTGLGASADKVNIVLRPFTQPIPGLNIKYFIYRGLRKSDFFDNDTPRKVIGGQPSDFIIKINEDFAAFHLPTAPPFEAAMIGYDESNTNLDAALSSFFFKESPVVANVSDPETDAFELPLIDKGKSLGYFAEGECGIDVVLNYGDYKHNFDNAEFPFTVEYARKTFSQITASGTAVEKKLIREQSTQFIDIAAFYGQHIAGGKVTITDSSGIATEKTSMDIYTDVISGFATKNISYVYIFGDRGRSYDFYDNYLRETGSVSYNMRYGVTPETMQPIEFSNAFSSQWPMLQIPSGFSGTIQSGIFKFFFQFVIDNNDDIALYCQTGQPVNATQGNFWEATFLKQPADTEGNLTEITNAIELAFSAVVDGGNKFVAGLTILHYQGVKYEYKAGEYTDEENVVHEIKAKPNYFDDVFDLINSKPLLELSADTQFSKMTSERIKLISSYINGSQSVQAVQTVTINDVIETGDENNPVLERVTYVTEAHDVMMNAVSLTGTATTDTKTTSSAGGSVGGSKTYELSEPFIYELKSFTDSLEVINGVLLKSSDGSTPAKIILGITTEENDLLKDLIGLGMKNPRLFLVDLFTVNSEFISLENVKYKKYKVGLVVEQTIGVLELILPVESLYVYSLDDRYHFSADYSEYIPEYKNASKLFLDLDLSL